MQKIIDKTYLENQFKNYNKFTLYKKVEAIPSHYEKVENSVEGALEIVANDTETVGDNQIKLENVTPVLPTSYTPTVGDFVKHFNEVAEYYKELYRKVDDSYSKNEIDNLLQNLIAGEIGDLYIKKDDEDIATIKEHVYEFEEYTQDEINELFDLSDEKAQELSKIINDSIVANNKLWSSKKISDELAKAILDSNAYSEGLLKDLSSISLEYVENLPTIGESNVIYILKAIDSSSNNTLNLYSNNAWVTIGDFTINLSEYVNKSDFNTELAKKANDDEVLKHSKIVQDLTTTSSDTVLSTDGNKTELDKKLDRNNDVDTLIDTNSSDNKVPSSKAVENRIKSNNLEIETYDVSKNTIEEILTGFRAICSNRKEKTVRLYDGTGQLFPIAGNYIGLLTTVNSNEITCYFINHWNTSIIYTCSLQSNDTNIVFSRVCTTKVANIPTTSIPIPSDLFPTFNTSSSYIKYDVTNGICTVYIGIRQAKRNTTVGNSVLSVPLPAPKSGKIEHTIKSEGGNIDLTIIITNGTSQMWASGDGTVICNYLGTFSYPVAEE